MPLEFLELENLEERGELQRSRKTVGINFLRIRRKKEIDPRLAALFRVTFRIPRIFPVSIASELERIYKDGNDDLVIFPLCSFYK